MHKSAAEHPIPFLIIFNSVWVEYEFMISFFIVKAKQANKRCNDNDVKCHSKKMLLFEPW